MGNDKVQKEKKDKQQYNRSNFMMKVKDFFKNLFRSRTGFLGFILVFIVIFMAIFAPLLAPHSPRQLNLRERLTPPIWMEEGNSKFILGTDGVGRDILSRIIYGSRISVTIGILSVLLGTLIGIPLGLVAGFYGGKVDTVIMRLADVQMSFPFILLAMYLLSILGGGLMNIIVVLGIGTWFKYARAVRGQVLYINELEYIDSARALGSKTFRILFRHVLPNTLAPIIVVASFSVAAAILSEAGLSFVGLGVNPEVPAWGSMLSEGRSYIRTAWWIVAFPGVAITLTVLGVNLLGDFLRDYLDPKTEVRETQ